MKRDPSALITMFEAQSVPKERPARITRAVVRRDLSREIILGRKNDSAALSNSFGECALLNGDRFAGAHVLDVGDADVCYNGEIWSGEPRERRDFARMIHANFPDRGIIGNGSRQNRERQADVVVRLGFEQRGNGQKGPPR